MEADKPIAVPSSSIPTTVITVLRYALTALGTAMVTRGILPVGADIEGIVGALLIIVSTGYGGYSSWKHNEEKKDMAPLVPDSVAFVKR